MRKVSKQNRFFRNIYFNEADILLEEDIIRINNLLIYSNYLFILLIIYSNEWGKRNEEWVAILNRMVLIGLIEQDSI